LLIFQAEVSKADLQDLPDKQFTKINKFH